MAHRIGIVGLGKITEDQHLPCIAKNPRFKLTGLVSQRGVARDGVPSFKTLGELLKSGVALDAVAICTPPNARHAIAVEAMDAGKHVLLEKPTTATTLETADLVAHAQKTKRVAYATWHSQYNAAVDEAKRLLSGQRIANLHVEWKEDVRRWHPGQEWIWAPGGFGIFDPGINALSIASAILPAPLLLQASELRFPVGKAAPIAADLAFDCDGVPVTASFDFDQKGPQTWDIDIDTDAGTLKLSLGASKMALDGKPVDVGTVPEYVALYARFARLLAARQSDADFTPFACVADAFLLGTRATTGPFA